VTYDLASSPAGLVVACGLCGADVTDADPDGTASQDVLDEHTAEHAAAGDLPADPEGS